jgi:hypothetical protein
MSEARPLAWAAIKLDPAIQQPVEGISGTVYGEYPPALVAAYGIATEPEPGVIAASENAVLGVHLLKLKSDGSDRLRRPEVQIHHRQGLRRADRVRDDVIPSSPYSVEAWDRCITCAGSRSLRSN